MRKVNFDEFNSEIEKSKKEVNYYLRNKYKSITRKASKSLRTTGEKEALTQLAIASWQNAEKAGKIKKLADRVMYYDYT